MTVDEDNAHLRRWKEAYRKHKRRDANARRLRIVVLFAIIAFALAVLV